MPYFSKAPGGFFCFVTYLWPTFFILLIEIWIFGLHAVIGEQNIFTVINILHRKLRHQFKKHIPCIGTVSVAELVYLTVYPKIHHRIKLPPCVFDDLKFIKYIA